MSFSPNFLILLWSIFSFYYEATPAPFSIKLMCLQMSNISKYFFSIRSLSIVLARMMYLLCNLNDSNWKVVDNDCCRSLTPKHNNNVIPQRFDPQISENLRKIYFGDITDFLNTINTLDNTCHLCSLFISLGEKLLCPTSYYHDIPCIFCHFTFIINYVPMCFVRKQLVLFIE